MKDVKSTGPRSQMQAESVAGKTEAKLGPLYDAVVNQGGPDRFTDLLNRLDKQDDKER
jgi:hypothetical protein